MSTQPKQIGGGDTAKRLRLLRTGAAASVSEENGLGFFRNRRAGLAKLQVAWHTLANAVELGTIKMRARETSTYSLPDARLADVTNLTGAVLASFSQFDVSTGGIRRQPEGSPDVLWRYHQASIEREVDAATGGKREAEGYLFVEVERDALMTGILDYRPARARSGKKRRPPGSGGWAAMDQPLIEEMKKLIELKPGMTPHRAAEFVAERAAGNGGLDTKQTRLAERYRKMQRFNRL